MRSIPRSAFTLLPVIVVAAVAGGCGGSTSSPTAPGTAPTVATSAAPSPGTTTTAQGSGALTAEANQTAAGDIPDNQAFITLRNAAGGYSVKYPEGWAQRGSGAKVTIQDKNNLVRIEILPGAQPTPAGVIADLDRLRQQSPSLSHKPAAVTTIRGQKVVKVVYLTTSAPNPVTDKRVTLVVDRYYVPGTGKYAIVDLGSPQGVDNVDAYRLMIESFRWV